MHKIHKNIKKNMLILAINRANFGFDLKKQSQFARLRREILSTKSEILNMEN